MDYKDQSAYARVQAKLAAQQQAQQREQQAQAKNTLPSTPGLYPGAVQNYPATNEQETKRYVGGSPLYAQGDSAYAGLRRRLDNQAGTITELQRRNDNQSATIDRLRQDLDVAQTVSDYRLRRLRAVRAALDSDFS